MAYNTSLKMVLTDNDTESREIDTVYEAVVEEVNGEWIAVLLRIEPLDETNWKGERIFE